MKKRIRSTLIKSTALVAFLSVFQLVPVVNTVRVFTLSIFIHHFTISKLFAPDPIKETPSYDQSVSTSSVSYFASSTSTFYSFPVFTAPKPVFSLLHTPRKVLIPNSSIPGNATFTLTFDNPSASILSQAKIYDITGAEVADLVEVTSAGSDPTIVSWNGRGRSGSIVRSGIYIYQVQADGKVINGSVVVAK